MTSQPPRLVDRIALWVAGLGVLLTASAFWFGGTHFGVSAMAGALVAISNWVALRWIGLRMIAASGARKSALSMLLVAKMVAVLCVCAALLLSKTVLPIAFVIGLGALVVGVALGGLSQALATAEEEGNAAR